MVLRPVSNEQLTEENNLSWFLFDFVNNKKNFSYLKMIPNKNVKIAKNDILCICRDQMLLPIVQ